MPLHRRISGQPKKFASLNVFTLKRHKCRAPNVQFACRFLCAIVKEEQKFYE
jgi:hypothetical protein